MRSSRHSSSTAPNLSELKFSDKNAPDQPKTQIQTREPLAGLVLPSRPNVKEVESHQNISTPSNKVTSSTADITQSKVRAAKVESANNFLARYRSKLESLAVVLATSPYFVASAALLLNVPSASAKLTSVSETLKLALSPFTTIASGLNLPSMKILFIAAAGGAAYHLAFRFIRKRWDRVFNKAGSLRTSRKTPLFSSLGRALPSASSNDSQLESNDFMKRLFRIVSVPLTKVIGPFLEEVLFRAIPFVMVANGSMSASKMGLLSSLVFAFMHNFTLDGDDKFRGVNLSPKIPGVGHLKFSLTHAPIPQFALGMAAWGLMQSQGFGAAFLFHCACNGLFSIGDVFKGKSSGRKNN